MRVAGVVLTALVSAALVQSGAVAGLDTGPGATRARPATFTRLAGTGATVRTVTLITGDRVTVETRPTAQREDRSLRGPQSQASYIARGGVSVSLLGITRGKGRGGMTFATSQVGGRLRVVPADALPMLRAGRLDMRLFDISALVDFGYDDRRPDLPLIVTGSQAALRSQGNPAGATRQIPGGTAVRAAKAGIGSMWQGLRGGLAVRTAGSSKVWLDGLRKPTLDQSVPQIGAPAAWAAGLTGSGVKVAVVDTGIDATHPDLAGKVVAAKDFTDSGDTRDLVGHGTHVAATIGSIDSRYKGVAPGAQLLSAKVCLDVGCPESAILAGMQWSVEQGAKVVNMSLGGGDTPEQDPLEAAVEDLTARFGALFVIAAGNSGADASIGSPGSADSALTVGAVTKTDELAGFSSRGPRTGDAALKPDITAPGVNIVAARSKDGFLGDPGATHMPLSGTSMATPHVAGAAAILVQQHPQWTPAELKAALMGSAKPSTTIGVYAQGAGRVDVAHAIRQQVLADPPSVSFGLQQWPHNDDAPVVRTVTYRNLGTAAVTLSLSLSGGTPAGMFTLSATSVTVPAGGTASVTLTANTSVASPDASFGGNLVATAGEVAVTTPFAVVKEVESYDVTVRHRNRAGQPAEDFLTFLLDLTSLAFVDVFGDPDVKLRVPKGRYTVFTIIFESGGEVSTNLLEPEFVVDRSRTLTRDARVGRPISVTPPQADARSVEASVDSVFETAARDGYGIIRAVGSGFDKLFAGTADPRARNPHVWGVLTGTWTKAGVEPVDSPYAVVLSWREQGRMFSGFHKRVTMGELATVEAEHAAQGPAAGELFIGARRLDMPPVSPGALVDIRLPGRRTEYLNTDDGVLWRRFLFEFDPETFETGHTLDSPPAAFKAGQRYHESRNRAVYGPGYADTEPGDIRWVTRLGDRMTLLPVLNNDQLNWAGFPDSGEFRTTLDRNGERILDEPAFGIQVAVPPGDATYRLGAEHTRGGTSELSTKVSCVWTFRSGTVGGTEWKPLPLSAVRFLPPLDQRNTAPAGRPFVVPLEVQRQPGSAAGPVRTLTVEVSYDDGATWRKVPVLRIGQQALVVLSHPAHAGFVSLRANSTDTAGNSVSETVIRAYRIA